MKKKTKPKTSVIKPQQPDPGTLAIGETHPASQSAFRYIASLGLAKQMMYMECFCSCAIENNRLGEICAETLRRVMNGEPVSDRYITNLAWSIREMEEPLNAKRTA